MDNFIHEIISCLNEDASSKELIILRIQELTQLNKTAEIYSNLLELFVHLHFEENDAKEHWKKIISNFNAINSHLRRNVGLRVALFDYFINLNNLLTEPFLVEIRHFKETEMLAMYDGLTGIFNRRYFDIIIKKELKRSQRYNKCFSLLIIDIDNFKTFNDTKSHLFGDRVLLELAEFIKRNCREEDSVCRYGGEEFAVILPELHIENAMQFAEKIRINLKKKTLFKKYAITFSGGISTYPFDGESIKDLIKNADKSLYNAKYSGKDCIIKSTVNHRRNVRYDKALKMHYQPLERSFQKIEESNEFFTQNISLGGFQFESADIFELKNRLLIRLQIPEEELILIGRIAWLKKSKNSENPIYQYGVEFCNISQEQIEKLRVFFNNGQ